MNQKGFLHLILYLVAAIIVFGGLFLYLFWFDKGAYAPGPQIKPSPTLSPQSKEDLKEAEKTQQLYDANKDEIKSKLDLSEEQYQLLKQYSSN